jgi:hypothetical protein
MNDWLLFVVIVMSLVAIATATDFILTYFLDPPAYEPEKKRRNR